MIKKEIIPGRPVHRIDLSLPMVQTDAYEIFCTIPSSHNSRTTLRPKVQPVENNKTINQTGKLRPPARLKHLLGPSFVNLFIDVHAMTAEATSPMPDAVSSPLLNSPYRHRLMKASPTSNKSSKQRNLKDESDQSRSSSDDRLLYESLGSFDEQNKNKIKKNNMWQNLHHPQLTTTKALHKRRLSKRSLNSNDTQLKVLNTTSIDTLSQESTGSANDQLYDRIEQLTKNYFPTIQQLRHSRPSAELLNNRMHLHRVQEKNFMPILSRTRAVR